MVMRLGHWDSHEDLLGDLMPFAHGYSIILLDLLFYTLPIQLSRRLLSQFQPSFKKVSSTSLGMCHEQIRNRITTGSLMHHDSHPVIGEDCKDALVRLADGGGGDDNVQSTNIRIHSNLVKFTCRRLILMWSNS